MTALASLRKLESDLQLIAAEKLGVDLARVHVTVKIAQLKAVKPTNLEDWLTASAPTEDLFK